jgi:hypothetical protein
MPGRGGGEKGLLTSALGLWASRRQERACEDGRISQRLSFSKPLGLLTWWITYLLPSLTKSNGQRSPRGRENGRGQERVRVRPGLHLRQFFPLSLQVLGTGLCACQARLLSSCAPPALHLGALWFEFFCTFSPFFSFVEKTIYLKRESLKFQKPGQLWLLATQEAEIRRITV